MQSENHLASALHVQLAEQMVDMQLLGGQGQVESAGNLCVAEPACDQRKRGILRMICSRGR